MRFVWIVLLTLATPVTAAEVGPCGGLDRIRYLVGQTKSYSQGKITIANVDTDGEPVCCSSHVLVLIPDPEIGSQCFAISDKAAEGDSSPRGFSAVGFDRITASYDPAKGLLLTIPYRVYNGGPNGFPASAHIRINLNGQGSVRIER